MDDAGHRRMQLVTDRVGPVLRVFLQLGGIGHKLRRDRVGRIGRIDQRRHLVGDRDREPLRDKAQFALPLRRDKTAFDEIKSTLGASNGFVFIARYAAAVMPRATSSGCISLARIAAPAPPSI